MSDGNPLADLRLRETIDFAERIDEIEDDLVPDLEERIDDAEAALEDGETPETPVAQLENVKEQLEGQATAMQRVNDAFDGDTEWTIQELMASEVSMLTDDVSEQSMDIDVQRQSIDANMKQGYHKIRTTQMALVDAPDGMPTQHDAELNREIYHIGNLPNHVLNYLYECILALNDSQSVEGVQNLSDLGLPERNTDA